MYNSKEIKIISSAIGLKKNPFKKDKLRKFTSNPAVGVNDLMLPNPNYHTPKGKHFLPRKEDGGMNDVENDKPATSIDGIVKQKGTFINNYIQKNVQLAMVKELQEEMSGYHQMPDGTMMDNNFMLPGGEPFVWENPQGGCTEQAKMTPGNPCYLPGYGGNSTPQGTFDAQGNQMTDAYGMMPQVSPYFTSSPQPPSDLNLSPNPNLMMSDVPMEFQAPKVNQTIMAGQSRVNEPNKQTINSKPSKGFQFSAPSGQDMANSIIGTMDFFSNQLAKREEEKQKKKNAWRYSGDANFSTFAQNNRGDYNPNSGMFRPDQYVPVQFAGSNYGNAGSNQYYAKNGGELNNDEMYLSDEEVQEILRNGGSVQLID